MEQWRVKLMEMSNPWFPDRKFPTPDDKYLLLADEIIPGSCKNCRIGIHKDWHLSFKVLGCHGHFRGGIKAGIWLRGATLDYSQQLLPGRELCVPPWNSLPSPWCGRRGGLSVGILQILAGFKERKHLHWPDVRDNKSQTRQSIQTMATGTGGGFWDTIPSPCWREMMEQEGGGFGILLVLFKSHLWMDTKDFPSLWVGVELFHQFPHLLSPYPTKPQGWDLPKMAELPSLSSMLFPLQ